MTDWKRLEALGAAVMSGVIGMMWIVKKDIMIPSSQGWSEDLSLPGMFLGWTRILRLVASVMCAGKDVDLCVSERPGLYNNIGSGLGTKSMEPGEGSHMPDLGSIPDNGFIGALAGVRG